MFAGPGKPAGATTNNYPRGTSHVAATCLSRDSLHCRAPRGHCVAPARTATEGGSDGKEKPPGDPHGIARQRSPATRTVTRTCPTCRPRNHRLSACLLPSLPPPSGLTASTNRPEFRRGALYQRLTEPCANTGRGASAPIAAPRAKFEFARSACNANDALLRLIESVISNDCYPRTISHASRIFARIPIVLNTRVCQLTSTFADYQNGNMRERQIFTYFLANSIC